MKTTTNLQKLIFSFIVISLVGINIACVSSEEGVTPVPDERILLVVTSDFMTGALSAVDLSNYEASNNLHALHQDSHVREVDGLPYILERQGGDSIIRLDKNNNFQVVFEESLRTSRDESVNPHDMVRLGEETALVSVYNGAELREVNLNNGRLTGRSLDVSMYSSDDSPPDISGLVRVEDFIYASVLDLGAAFTPVRSRLLQIDVSDPNDMNIVNAPEMPFGNVGNRIQVYSSVRGVVRVIGAGVGRFGSNDGGVISYNISDNSFDSPTFQEEEQGASTGTFGRDITQVFYASAAKAFALLTNSRFENFVVAFDPGSRTITEEMLGPGSYFEIFLHNDMLFVADRTIEKPGVRIFDVNTLEERTENPIDVGLPPYSMVVIE